MGRKLDLTGLTDNEAEHVLQVVQRDMRLRKKEEERLSELKQELDEEGSRCLLLSRQACFNQRCCIRCCSPFTFLLNPKRQCRDCRYNVCKACRVYSKRDKAWLCSACQKSRLLKTQSLEWFYTNVKKRFKRFGSAKVLKTLYRKHLAEHSALSELTDGSACDESICNEGSVCGSDSTFYRQTEEHSVAETLSVALRVAEEAIDEAISKAEFGTSTQESQNEALYLREHRGELVEELAQTIVQKIISRKNALAEMRAEYAHGWVSEQNTDPHHRDSACDQPSGSLKQQVDLWRSHSAFTLLDNNQPALKPDVPKALKKDGGASAMTAWKSVDRLDNSVLKSPDGNWIALQTTQLSRPGLLTKRKSLVYSALERESGVVSAYEGLGSDSESKSEPDSSWGAALQEIHKKMTNQDDFGDNIMTLTGRQGNKDDPLSDSEGNLKHSKPLIALLKRKMPAEFRKPSSRRTSIIDVDFNFKGAEREKDELKLPDEQEEGKIRKSRKKRRSKKEPAASTPPSDLNNKEPFYSQPSDAATPHTSAATTPEPFDPSSDAVNHTVNDFTSKLNPCPGTVYEFCPREEERDEEKYKNNDGQQGERSQRSGSETDVNLEEGERTGEEKEKDDGLQHRLCSLVSQANLTYLSSTEDESDGVGQSEGEWDMDADMDKGDEEQVQIERLTYRLCQLKKQVRATQFSSTEDELDRMGLEMENMEHEVGKDEDLAVRLCRLANEVNASQYSSTEDELDKAGRGEDGADETELWSVQPGRTQLRDLASLVSASQFSSTEDELDRLGNNEGKQEQEENGGSRDMRELWKGEESIGDIDMEMFNLTDETEEREQERGERGKCQRKVEDDATGVQKDKRVAEEGTMGMRQLYDKYMELFKEPSERKEITLKAEMKTELLQEAKAEEETESPSKGTDEKVEQEFLKGSEQSERKFETDSKSDEDEAEFDRIISSMLMMTLEDMQGEMMDKAGQTEQRKPGERRCRGRDRISERKDATEETHERSESVITICISEETNGEISDKKQKGNSTGRDENIYEENRRDTTTITELQISQTKLTSPKSEEKSENQDGRRRNTAESEAAEMHRDKTNCEQKDGDGQVKNEQKTENMEQCSSCTHLGEFLSPEEIHNGSDMELFKTIELMSSVLEQRYSAASLRSITTEVLKVLNATEELLQGVEGQDETRASTISLPPNTDPKKLDQQFWKLEENVYVAAGSVYSLEAELSDLEECAREICSSTSDLELSFLEEQVAAAAAKVQQSELQISDISARIAALKSAGLNVDTQSRFTKTRAATEKSVTLDSSRHLRRRLPAPPAREDKEA
ncbi:LOW QUALITY PROTEIN: rab effector MyRIP [Xiphophorus hellerii]|uniref:LOW QUALITY PROTEIN: rab effector MyRIP n=1 Tax=Xiphophorus hellerii TaxID=8084 RepID=UPI0013B40BE9|nr:LOW QUALITY PROTEIN: rab effector MyRIP-like [Xiphophorus hellerii]